LAASAAVRHLERDGVDGFWLHLDANILDPAVMPAVDSPDPGGLGHDELAALLTPLVASPCCVGLDVTVLDPDLDPDGGLALDLTDTLAGLAPALTARKGE
jgi:arginase